MVEHENAAALTQHGAVGSTARAEQRHDVASAAAETPGLSDLPPEPKVPGRESVDEWSVKSMGGYLDAATRHDAWMHAARAGQLQKSGGSHQDIMQALAAAEMAAPAGEDREFHAKRLDAYAQAHGLKGFYRYESPFGGGRHMVQVNKIRTPEEGDHGRYYASDPFRKGSPQIIDRDTGLIVGHAADAKAAQARIVELEALTPRVPNTVVHQPDPDRSPGPGTGLRVGDAAWHPDGPAIGAVRELSGDTARVTFRDLPEKRVPVAELTPISPGDPVTVAIRHSRPRLGETQSTFTVRQGVYVGPVPLEPSLSHVRTGGDLRRVPTEYLSVPGLAGQAAALAWSRRLAAPARASGPGRGAGPHDPLGAQADEVKAGAAQDNGNHAVTASPVDAFPHPVRLVAPETDGTGARKTGDPRSGQQVTPRGQGRA